MADINTSAESLTGEQGIIELIAKGLSTGEPAERLTTNPLVDTPAQTASNVAAVLSYLRGTQPPNGCYLNEHEEQGRFLILTTCIDALEAITDNA